MAEHSTRKDFALVLASPAKENSAMLPYADK
jgi:hypothetical protein